MANIDELYEQLFGHKSDGAFVEVGGHDGYSFSNTWGLAETGWKGLYIEPVRKLAELCEWTHEKNNVKVIQCAVGDHNSDELVKLYVNKDNIIAAYASLDEKNALGHDVINVPLKTLGTILTEEDFPGVFDLLVIDTEGTEIDVLKGINLHNRQAQVIIIETNGHAAEISEYLTRQYYYDLMQNDGLNAVYRRNRP
jgi:FkbM family methyltransferase